MQITYKENPQHTDFILTEMNAFAKQLSQHLHRQLRFAKFMKDAGDDCVVKWQSPI